MFVWTARLALSAVVAVAPSAHSGECDPFPVADSIGVQDTDLVDVADLNGDGAPDLVMISERESGSGAEVRVILNDGAGGFDSAPVLVKLIDSIEFIQHADGVKAADLNADGDVDLICLVVANSRFYVLSLINEGGLEFGEPQVVLSRQSAPILEFDSTVVTDVDGDGIADLAFFTPASQLNPFPLVSTYRGLGDGMFAQLSTTLSADDCVSLTVAEPIVGGSLGLVTLHHDTETKLYGHTMDAQGVLGSSTLVYSENIEGRSENRVLFKDLDGDGDPDLVMNNADRDRALGVFENSGGTIAAPVWYSRGVPSAGSSNGVGFGVLDLDGDGDLDVVSGDRGGEPRVYPGNGDGTFAAAVRASQADASDVIFLEDLDLDGRVDLLIGGPDELQTLRNEGGLRFGPSTSIDTGEEPLIVEFADLNADGYPDAAVMGRRLSEISVHLSDGVGGFFPRVVYDTTDELVDIQVADLDSDGAMDVIATTFRSVYIFHNDGAGTLTGSLLTLGSFSFTRVHDLDGDLIPDLMIGQESRILKIFLGAGDGTFIEDAPLTLLPESEDVVDAQLGDLDGDGSVDGVFWDEEGSVFVVSGVLSQEPVVRSKTLFGSFINGAKLADLDGDGDLDVTYLNLGDESITVAINSGGRFLFNAVFALPDVPIGGIEVHDFNRDGLLDIVVGARGRAVIAYNDGGAFFFEFDSVRLGDRNEDIAIADLDLDGDVDIVAADYFFDQLRIAWSGCGSSPCSDADLDSSGSLNFGDVTAFLTLYGNGDLGVDLDNSGALNFGDVTAFLTLYAQGCP